MRPFTLGEAARLTGKSKSTITRAIKGGRLSAHRREDGGYVIDPAELARVYEVQPHATVARPVELGPTQPPDATPVAELKAKLAAAEAALSEAREALGRERESVDDLRRRLDRSEERLAAFLAPPPERRRGPGLGGWWARVVGRLAS